MMSAGGYVAGQKSQEFDLSKISQSMSSFVEHESGVDGAEFPRETAENGDRDGQMVGSGMIEAMQKLFDFPDEEDSTDSDMSEYDWSEDSDDELGSPSKMSLRTKKSSLRQPAKKVEATNWRTDQRKSKSVRFSGPDLSTQESSLTSRTEEQKPSPLLAPQNTSCPITEPETVEMKPAKAPVIPPRPSKLVASPSAPPRPSKPPPPRPAINPPPVPARSTTNSRPAQPLNKPSGVVKPSVPPPPPPGKDVGGKRDKKLEALMDAMDRELAATDVGKSFEREPKRAKPRRPGRPPAPPSKVASDPRDIDDEDDDFRPVNVDLTVVKNTLESYKAQQGLPGPASNILAGFGLKLPDDDSNAKA
ncbi:protein ecdysoneless homolog [Elysia marginata]|uniref:Protein ecdysoneless homolog n=1 Tax=Elysia marginata TaxID=1093978 RepID=A0AAV4GHA4_9GAST|nr:protein ecdysoneless homolog [Elysia marginata]